MSQLEPISPQDAAQAVQDAFDSRVVSHAKLMRGLEGIRPLDDEHGHQHPYPSEYGARLFWMIRGPDETEFLPADYRDDLDLETRQNRCCAANVLAARILGLFVLAAKFNAKTAKSAEATQRAKNFEMRAKRTVDQLAERATQALPGQCRAQVLLREEVEVIYKQFVVRLGTAAWQDVLEGMGVPPLTEATRTSTSHRQLLNTNASDEF